jgi:hypothetical protein
MPTPPPPGRDAAPRASGLVDPGALVRLECGEIGGCRVEVLLAEHPDAVPFEEGGGDALAGDPPAAERAVVDVSAATGRAALLQDGQPDPAGRRRLQDQMRASEEGGGGVLAGGRQDATGAPSLPV